MPSDISTDPMRVLYLQSDMVCFSSVLVLILRAVSTTQGFLNGISDECIESAREVFDLHQECMASVRECKTDPSVAKRYVNW